MEKNLAQQHLHHGFGPKFHRIYRTTIAVPFSVAKRALLDIQNDMDKCSPKLLARFEKTQGQTRRLKVGDEFQIHISGPWNGPVRVAEVQENSFKLVTLDGHMEAGEIVFRVAEKGPLETNFEIESFARSRDRLVDFFYDKLPIAKAAQTTMWTSFCQNFACRASHGKISDPEVSVLTQKIDENGTPLTEYRIFRGWTEAELKSRLEVVKQRDINFPTEGPESQAGKNWRRYYSESVVAIEKTGPIEANGPFQKVWQGITEYRFSDPTIVEGHFNPQEDLKNRSLLLEIKVLGLRYLCGVRIRAVKQEVRADKTIYGFRYDTLAGHLETGSEWFLLTKIHETGEVLFRISASWRPGVFPNWWSRLGFHLLSKRYQLTWHRLAYLRLREIAGSVSAKLSPVPRDSSLFHSGDKDQFADLWLENATAVQKVLEVGSPPAPGPTSERNN